MIPRLLLLLLLLAATSSAEEKPNEALRGILYFEFGEIGDDRKITSSTNIPWRIGGKYGWAATIFSKDPKVVLKEVLILPEPAIFSEGEPQKKPEQILSSTNSVSDDRILTREITLDVTKPVKYGRGYTIIESDPEGPHILRLYVNGELAREVNFKIEKHAEPADASNHSPRVTPAADAPVAPRSDGR